MTAPDLDAILNLLAAMFAWFLFMKIPALESLPDVPRQHPDADDMERRLGQIMRMRLVLAIGGCTMMMAHFLGSALLFQFQEKGASYAWLTAPGAGLVLLGWVILAFMRMDLNAMHWSVGVWHDARKAAAASAAEARQVTNNVSYMSDYRPPTDARSDN